jgi:hypothetical protein
VGYSAKRLIRLRLGAGNRCFVMLHVEAKAGAKRGFGTLRARTAYASVRPGAQRRKDLTGWLFRRRTTYAPGIWAVTNHVRGA